MNDGMKSVGLVLCLSLAPAVQALAQQSANPLVSGQQFVYSLIKNNLIRAAEKMPEENYSFKPTPEVRNFGQLLAHVAESQFPYCYSVTGEKNPLPRIENVKTSKADLVAALKEAFSYCDKAFASLTDAKAVETVNFFGRQQPRLTVLTFGTAHDDEHYGNVVTYMRLKGLVPPSSEGRQ
jgi:uncharacterized damage-inducible protein DinB